MHLIVGVVNEAALKEQLRVIIDRRWFSIEKLPVIINTPLKKVKAHG